ncbi:S-norcoclaurine synthase 1 [Acorus calamus]|uniref:S-norcoclaurine synthase 1 n=1 Tax=Acorus calamus TaxID=4465 RepID=A0AAV9CYG6_ACOCL|nr:S-norcoclaurine synthase 1 [Acorus calamus]
MGNSGTSQVLEGQWFTQKGVQDEVLWRPQPRLSFSVRGFYDWWRRDLPRFETTALKAAEIWRPKIPLKEKLLTRVYRAKWVLDADTRCPLCEMEEETVLHLFIDCPFARQLWRLLKGATGMEDQFSSLIELWEAGRRLRSKGDRSILSNGKYKSINHRGMVDREKERLSIATFMSPSYETEFGPIPELVRDGEALYKEFKFYNKLVKNPRSTNSVSSNISKFDRALVKCEKVWSTNPLSSVKEAVQRVSEDLSVVSDGVRGFRFWVVK